MTGTGTDGFARELFDARREGRTLTSLLTSRGLDTLAGAYTVQRALTALRVARGERVVGWKLGYTSVAMREQMGVAEPNFGPLTDAMLLADGSPVPERALQPRVEPEIALVLSGPVLPGAGVDEVLERCRRAHAALEVVDSVWPDYRFTLLDNTADGSSAGWVVLGDELPLADHDRVDVALTAADGTVSRATGAAAGGHPALGVGWLAAQLAGDERGLQAGDVVITGGLTAAVPLSGPVSARFGDGVTVSVAGVQATAPDQPSTATATTT